MPMKSCWRWLLISMVLKVDGSMKKKRPNAFNISLQSLEEWENLERKEGEFSIAVAVIGKWLSKMKRVQKGNSMAAKTAQRIEEGLDFREEYPGRFPEKSRGRDQGKYLLPHGKGRKV